MNPKYWQSIYWTGITWCLLVLLQGCSTTAPHTTPALQASTSERSPQAVTKGNDIALMAMSLLDKRYTYGGRTPSYGLDCSGLVSHVYKEAVGIDLRGSSASMARQTKPVQTPDLYPGDLVFFNTLGNPYSHVGVYVGEGKFVHAANERSGIRIDKLSDRYYATRFEGARSLWD